LHLPALSAQPKSPLHQQSLTKKRRFCQPDQGKLPHLIPTSEIAATRETGLSQQKSFTYPQDPSISNATREMSWKALHFNPGLPENVKHEEEGGILLSMSEGLSAL
jgi:hypothetical protein